MEISVVQAIAAVVIPPAIVALKKVTPTVSGSRAFWLNLGLNFLVALGAQLGLGVPAAQAWSVGALAGFGGAKLHDVVKNGVDPRVFRQGA